MLKEAGADEVIIDDESIVEQITKIQGGRYDDYMELTSTKTIMHSAARLKPKGIVCITGNQGLGFLKSYQLIAIPNRVRVYDCSGGGYSMQCLKYVVRDVD